MQTKYRIFIIIIGLMSTGMCQVPPNINSGNPNFPFPQFKAYTGGATTLANKNPIGVPHAEMEQRTKDAYRMICNNMTYNILRNGVTAPITVAGVRYIMPNALGNPAISHCSCVEGDGYYLLAAAYMGDKAIFDGYYMWAHDRAFQNTRRFIDCQMNSPNYGYSPGLSGGGSFGASLDVIGGGLTGNSAADGDVDVAMALLVAWKQWGDAATICINPCTGLPLTYKQEAIRYIKAMADTSLFRYFNGTTAMPNGNYVSGIIGLDGYMKNGDSWAEITSWANGGYTSGGNTMIPETKGPQFSYVDYNAPAYFKSFANMLSAEGESNWCIEQYKRGEASCDWITGQAFNQGYIPWIGQVNINNDGSAVTFNQFNPGGEDFRYGWRTILNYLWYGAPSITWNPVTHAYTTASNTYNLDMAKRFATFLKNPERAPYNNNCFDADASVPGLMIGGPSNIRWEYEMDGTNGGAFVLPMPLGPASPSAVVAGDWDLMAQLFRQCVISFDDQGGANAQRYLTATPQYFHEWFRMLGMLVLTGNFQDPMTFTSKANMKVYKAVDKTFAYIGDTVTYTVSYRNYGKDDAASVVIKDTLDAGYTFISENSGKVSVSGNILTWDIGLVKGMNTGDVIKTQDSLKFKVLVNSGAPPRICNTATITEDGVFHWVSNEYPNRITEVMERNCVDILGQKPLSLTKTVDKATANPGDVLTYTIVVKNRPTPFLNGGRQGVFISGAHNGVTASQAEMLLKYRITHGAHEPLINYKNYRVSYFMNQTPIPTWGLVTTINEGSATNPSLTQQTLPVGVSWNHRFILTFPDQRATTTYKLTDNRGDASKIHEGALAPMRLVNQINAGWVNFNALDDWSAETGIVAADGAAYFPIANDWTDPLLPNQPVTKLHPDQCGTVTNTIKKQLVEEWDGYTWRRIYGDAPVTGRELTNLVVRDFLPAEVTFQSYVAGYPVGTLSGSTITWPTITELLPNDSVVYKFTAIVKSCDDFLATNEIVNIAEAKATNEPAVKDTAITVSSCGVTPVRFLDFKGSLKAGKSLLTWVVAQEVNNSHFEVLKSRDGRHFQKIGVVKAKGSHLSQNSYDFVDKEPYAGNTYYKLVQVDHDGTRLSSNVIVVSKTDLSHLQVYPNPFSNQIHVEVSGYEYEMLMIDMSDVAGKHVFSGTYPSSGQIILGNELPSGTYILKVTIGEDVMHVKVSKQ